ncbi:hypothetical protein AXF42_Ash009830 [Apostasia shenzhenica]|uniref:RING-type E3 ubiquitin transferase n=1 Tax=Apostasia shenzhenica TaxID=1088818 RepID=A0A2I0AX94_9ASPA|nr:hypothetical protein AXF42_Ash009830 [Apostasia shenzhenica]
MLQIRLSKGPSADGGGGAARSTAPAETVTVACPEHLVIADLPVAKSVGAVTASATSCGRIIGRRSRRQLGERIHFCVRCDFPVAIYGRLVPCEHAFCLACARNDSSCYLCDERVQKIQTIKMMEGIFICAAPHCLKSFLKQSSFEAHIHETHADLLQPNAEKEGTNESNPLNVTKPPSADTQRQSSLPEASTARGPARSGFYPNSQSQSLDREDNRPRRHSSRDQPPTRPPMQLRPPPFPARPPHQAGDIQADSNSSRVTDQPYNWFPQPHRFENSQHGTSQFSLDGDQLPPPKSLLPNSSYPAQLSQHLNFPMPLNPNQPLMAPPFNYPSIPADGSHPFYNEIRRPESTAIVGGSDQGSVLGIPPAESFPRPFGMGLMGMPFQPIPAGQGVPEGFANPSDSQGGIPFFQGVYGQGLLLSSLPGKESEQRSGSGMQSSMPLPPPPPPLPPQNSQQLGRVREGQQGFGWKNDKGRYGTGSD